MSSPLVSPYYKGFLPSGSPNAGGSVTTFAAGTSTPLATYSDAALTVPNANPVILNAMGEAIIYVGPLSYKLIEKDQFGATLRTFDSYGPNLATPSPAVTEWTRVLTAAGAAPAFGFISATSFTVNAGPGGDLLGNFGLALGDRIKTINTIGTVYSTITGLSYSAPNNTVVVINDGAGVIDAGLSAMWYGLNRYVNPSYLDPRTALMMVKNGNSTGYAAATKITGWNLFQDNNGEWDIVNNQWKCRYPGNYLIDLQAEISDTGVNQVVLAQLAVGGTPAYSYYFVSPAVANAHLHISARRLGALVSNQTIQFFLTGTVNTTVYGTNVTAFQVTRVA